MSAPKKTAPAESPLDFLPIGQMEVGRLIAEALMARGQQDMAMFIHRAMNSQSYVGLGFIAACNKRLAAP